MKSHRFVLFCANLAQLEANSDILAQPVMTSDGGRQKSPNYLAIRPNVFSLLLNCAYLVFIKTRPTKTLPWGKTHLLLSSLFNLLCSKEKYLVSRVIFNLSMYSDEWPQCQHVIASYELFSLYCYIISLFLVRGSIHLSPCHVY